MILLSFFAVVTAITQVGDSYPTLSPDGLTLLFQSNRSGRQALWISQPNGENPRILFDRPAVGSDPGTPRWSPDGRMIVFGMRPAGAKDPNESEIYLIDVDGRGLQRLTSAPGDDSHPHWSSDGRRIFFDSARATPDLKAPWGQQWIDIYSMAADGSDVRRLTDCRTLCTYPVPSSNGHYLAFRKVIDVPGRDWSQATTSRNSEVFVASIDGTGARNLSNDAHFDGWPMWSPGSGWIAFSSGRDGNANSGQIYAIRPDGTGLHRLTNGPFSHVQPSFAGSGTIYAYQEMEAPGREGSDFEVGGIVRIEVDLNSSADR